MSDLIDLKKNVHTTADFKIRSTNQKPIMHFFNFVYYKGQLIKNKYYQSYENWEIDLFFTRQYKRKTVNLQIVSLFYFF